MNETKKEQRMNESAEFQPFQNERMRGEEKKYESKELLRLLFECAPDAYYLNDLKGTFIDGNKVAEELTGFKKEELIGKSFLKTNSKSSIALSKKCLGASDWSG
jgi:PAS domain-containing protein